MDLHVVDHPIAADRLRILRDATTRSAKFRRALHHLSLLLMVEATRTLITEDVEVITPLQPAAGRELRVEPLIAPVLRAGLGMLDAAQLLLPQGHVAMLGFRRDETSLDAERYLAAIPQDLEQRPVFVLDPMVATGGTVGRALDVVTERNGGPTIVVGVLASPEGVAAVESHGGARELVVASVDERLNEVGYIVPGLGDAGDRQYGWS